MGQKLDAEAEKRRKQMLFRINNMVIASVLATFLVGGTALAGNRPAGVIPFEGRPDAIDTSHASIASGLRGVGPGIQAGADHIASQQCPVGGFCWPHGNACCPTAPTNITGPIGLGLLHAHTITSDPAHLAAATLGGDYDLTVQYPNTEFRLGAFTAYFLWKLTAATGDTQYQDHAATAFYDELAAGTYGPSDYDTLGWIGAVEASRTGTWVNLRPWEFHNQIPAADVLGNAGQSAAFEAACLAGLNTLDNTDPSSVYSDLIGVAGGVRGLSFAGTTAFPAIVAPNHAGVNGLSTLQALADYLASQQNADGSWNWHSDLSTLGGATETDKDTQTTAYAILALLEADAHVASDYSSNIESGRAWLRTMQLLDGGFMSYPGGSENTEVEAEALNALAPDSCTQDRLEFQLASGSECVQPTETVEVELHQLNLSGPVRGYQAFAQFDSSVMTHVSNVFTSSPYAFILEDSVSGDELNLAAGIDDNTQSTTSADALLATISFTAGAVEGPTTVSFRATSIPTPPSRFSDPFGGEVTPCLVQSPTIVVDGTAPVLTCPVDLTIECDESTDPSNTGSATATDNLDPSPFVDYSDVITPTGCDEEWTITRTWTAIDCAGNESMCVQTITVEDSTAPVVTCPADTTIECDASTAPNDLNIGLEFPFDANPTLGASQAPGVWYTDRYAPFGFASVFFDGDNRLRHSIDASDCSPCRGGQSSSFYDTQGRKYDLPADTTRMSIDLYIPADWATTERRMAGFWGTAVDSGDVISGFPIIEFTSTTDDSGVPRFRGWTSEGSGGWIDMGLPTGFVYDAWYTLEIELVGASWVFRVGDLELLTPGLGSVRIDNLILQGHNNTAGVTYDIHWDNYLAAGSVQATDNCDPAPSISFSDSSVAGACPQESTITRTWTATDCAGNSSSCDQTIELVDTTAPVIGACPADIEVNADAGDCDAVVTFTPPTATDNCDGAPTVVCDWPSGSTFPSGTTLVTCTATDGCNNSSACDFNVTVNAFNDLTVDVELDPAVSMPASVTRCITFELWECPGGAPAATVTADMLFLNGLASDTIDIPCGNYTCITARDELHTLRRTDLDDFGISGTEYVADFTASGATDDDSLIGGNLNDDFFIDILDFGTFSAQWATTPSPDTPCPVGGAHADINSDANVDNLDFSFIQNNFLETHEANCCGALNREAGGSEGPVTDISIAELRRRGLGHLAVSDLNHDGRLNMDDVIEFANGARPQKLKPDHAQPQNAQLQSGIRRPGR